MKLTKAEIFTETKSIKFVWMFGFKLKRYLIWETNCPSHVSNLLWGMQPAQCIAMPITEMLCLANWGSLLPWSSLFSATIKHGVLSKATHPSSLRQSKLRIAAWQDRKQQVSSGWWSILHCCWSFFGSQMPKLHLHLQADLQIHCLQLAFF